MTALIDVIENLKNDGYTGENRCSPCTVVNLAIALAFSASVWMALASVSRPEHARWIGAGAFAGSVAMIYFRGYFVPGTPTLTKRYLPKRVLTWFGKEPAGPPSLQIQDGADPVETLCELDILARNENEELSVTDGFQRQIVARTDELDEATAVETLETVLSADRQTVTVDRHADGFAVQIGDETVSMWPSDAAMRTDAAVASALDERMSGWASPSPQPRLAVLKEVRSRLDHCPFCRARATIDGGFVESCCSMDLVSTLVCDECGVRLHEFSEGAI